MADLTSGTGLPPLQTAADAASGRSQQAFFRLTRIGLLLGLVGAAGGAASIHITAGHHRMDAAAGVAVVAFAALVATTTYIFRAQPERRWYQARAVAESVRSLSWQYAMGAGEFRPHEADVDSDRAGERFLAALPDVLAGMDRLSLAVGEPGAQISGQMRAARATATAERLALYRRERIDHQVAWYTGNARKNAAKARWAFVVSLVIQILGIAAGVVVAVTALNVDLLGVAAAAAAAVTAWQQARDYDNLAEAYRVTANDLRVIVAGLPAPGEVVDDERLAEVVDSTEQAISREHTIWRARRGLGDHGVR